MNPRELRIGNFINYSDYGPSVITKVDGDGFCSFVPYRWSGDIGKMLSEIDPIPLTEEWLIKFGFEDPGKKVAGLKGSGYLTLMVGRHMMIIWNNGQWELSYNLAGEAVQAPCPQLNFVHQLQNLYFALTGEELTISEPTKQP